MMPNNLEPTEPDSIPSLGIFSDEMPSYTESSIAGVFYDGPGDEEEDYE